MLPGDTILQTCFLQTGTIGSGGATGRIRKIDWAGNITWQYDCSGATYQAHHDVCAMPNGNILLIVYESKTQAECIAKGATAPPVNGIWSEKIIEVKPTGPSTGEIVWEWHLWDHLCQNTNAGISETYVNSIAQHPELMNINYNLAKDWFHMNDLDYNAILDQIIMSSRTMSEIYVIDHSTTSAQAASHTGGNSGKGGDFLYRWGHPQNYECAVDGNNSGFNAIHDAHWISADHPLYPNYMCAYNNNSGSNVQIVFWQPPYNGYNYDYTPGLIIGPTTCIKPPIPSFTTLNQGGSEQLHNGNNLVSNPVGNIYEVSPNGIILQTIINARATHAYRHEKCYVRGPTANANVSADTICSGNEITLNSSATSVSESSPTYTYSWYSSPVGFTSNMQNPVFNPTVSSVYSVIITNSAIGCSDTANVSVTVLPAPIANAGNDTSITSGGTAVLHATGGLFYTWNNGATTNTIAVSPQISTIYSVTVTDSNGCASDDQVIVTIPGSFLNATAITSSDTICIGTSATLGVSTSVNDTMINYSWTSDPAGFYSTLQNPVVSPNISTIYTVIASNGVLSDTSSVTVTVKPLPFPANTINGPISVCQGEANTEYSIYTIFNATGYHWTVPVNASIFNGSNTNSIIVNFSDSALSGNITVNGTNECGSGIAANIPVYVYSKISANAGSDQNIAYGSNTVLNADATGGSGSYNYIWAPAIFLDSATIQNPNTIPLTDSIIFYLTVTDNISNCFDTALTHINIVENNLNVISTATISTICSGDEIQLFCNPTGGNGIYTFEWTSIPAGFYSTEQNPIIQPAESGFYNVSVTSGNISASASVSITVNPIPTMPTITLNNDTLYSSVSIGNQWILNDTLIPGATNNSVFPFISGLYQVEVTDTNGCSVISDGFDFIVTISEKNADSHISIFPNPTNGKIIINSNLTFTINIYDVIGNLIYTADNSKTIDISEFEGGIYFIKIQKKSVLIFQDKIHLIK